MLVCLLVQTQVHGGFIDNFAQKATSRLKPILSGIDKAITSFENQLKFFKTRVFDGIDALKQGSQKVQDSFGNYINSLADKLKEAVSKFADGKTDVTPCGDIVTKFRDQVQQLYNSSRSCATNQIDNVIGRVRSVTESGERVLVNLRNARKSIFECGNNLNGFKNITIGIKCFHEASSKAGGIIAKEIPGFISESAKALANVFTSRPRVQACMTSSLLKGVLDHYNNVLKQFGKCLASMGKSLNPKDFPAVEPPKLEKPELPTLYLTEEQDEDFYNEIIEID